MSDIIHDISIIMSRTDSTKNLLQKQHSKTTLEFTSLRLKLFSKQIFYEHMTEIITNICS